MFFEVDARRRCRELRDADGTVDVGALVEVGAPALDGTLDGTVGDAVVDVFTAVVSDPNPRISGQQTTSV